jgi:hypothetical protein
MRIINLVITRKHPRQMPSKFPMSLQNRGCQTLTSLGLVDSPNREDLDYLLLRLLFLDYLLLRLPFLDYLLLRLPFLDYLLLRLPFLFPEQTSGLRDICDRTKKYGSRKQREILTTDAIPACILSDDSPSSVCISLTCFIRGVLGHGGFHNRCGTCLRVSNIC